MGKIEAKQVDTKEISQNNETILSWASQHNVDSYTAYVQGAEGLNNIKIAKGAVASAFDESIRNLNLAHKKQLAIKKQYSEPLETAEKIIKEKMAKYTETQDKDEIDKVDHVSYTERWTAVVTDEKELLRSILAGKLPMNAVKVNMIPLNKLAGALGELAFRKVKGVKPVKKRSIRVI